MTTAIILAAGKSTRMGGAVDKAFISIGGKPVLAWSLIAFERSPEIDGIVLVVRKEQILASGAVAKMFGISKLQAVVPGGAKRSESVQAGLAACGSDTDRVVIHDAARPCINSEIVSAVAKAVKRTPAVTVGRPVTDTVKRCGSGTSVVETVPREKLWTVQTPQAFQFKVVRDALAAAKASKIDVTDDCQAVESAGVPVKIIENLKPNPKITTPDDVQMASALLK